eukprot:Selendium_serpulae@DN2020_c0_g1_i2.p1
MSPKSLNFLISHITIPQLTLNLSLSLLYKKQHEILNNSPPPHLLSTRAPHSIAIRESPPAYRLRQNSSLANSCDTHKSPHQIPLDKQQTHKTTSILLPIDSTRLSISMSVDCLSTVRLSVDCLLVPALLVNEFADIPTQRKVQCTHHNIYNTQDKT